ncbi:MAG: AzlD domain-containing protein [Pseudomonadota bacterium]
MTYTNAEIWLIIVLLGIGTFLIRFSFLGLIGDRPIAAWLLRHLRYTAVAIIPAMVTPLVLWPSATDGQTDVTRLAAAAAALAAGYLTRNAIWAILAGMGTLYLLGWLL